jgi:hypothetical protein
MHATPYLFASMLFVPLGANAIPAQVPARPQVICRPCGETPPPKGFTCTGQVMIDDSVTTADAPRVAATCNVSDKPSSPSSTKTLPVPPHKRKHRRHHHLNNPDANQPDMPTKPAPAASLQH